MDALPGGLSGRAHATKPPLSPDGTDQGYLDPLLDGRGGRELQQEINEKLRSAGIKFAI